MGDDVVELAPIGRRLRPRLRDRGGEVSQACLRLRGEVEDVREWWRLPELRAAHGKRSAQLRKLPTDAVAQALLSQERKSSVTCAGIPSAAELSTGARHDATT